MGERSEGDKRVEELENRSEGIVLREGRNEGGEEYVEDGQMKKVVKRPWRKKEGGKDRKGMKERKMNYYDRSFSGSVTGGKSAKTSMKNVCTVETWCPGILQA